MGEIPVGRMAVSSAEALTTEDVFPSYILAGCTVVTAGATGERTEGSLNVDWLGSDAETWEPLALFKADGTEPV